MNIKFKFCHLKKVFIIFSLYILSCSIEDEISYKTTKSRFYSSSQILVDSTEIYRNKRSNDQLNVELKYQARIINTDYDSIKWEFPGGNPEKISDVTEIPVNYNKYGTYDAKLILLKYDTLNYRNIRLLVDTITLRKKAFIKYKEKSWNSYDSNSVWSSIGSEITYINVNEIYDNYDPLSLKTNFTGFENNRVRVRFDFKIALNNPLPTSSYTNSQKKLELKIDDFNRFSVAKIKDDQYYSGYFDIFDKDEFELKFEVFPPLTSSNWNLLINGENIPMYNYYTSENESFLIGYSNQTSISSATIKLNDLSYGSSDNKNLKLGDTTKIEIPEGLSKMLVTLNDGLPSSFQILTRRTGNSLNNNEYYYKIFIKNLIIEVL